MVFIDRRQLQESLVSRRLIPLSIDSVAVPRTD